MPKTFSEAGAVKDVSVLVDCKTPGVRVPDRSIDQDSPAVSRTPCLSAAVHAGIGRVAVAGPDWISVGL